MKNGRRFTLKIIGRNTMMGENFVLLLHELVGDESGGIVCCS